MPLLPDSARRRVAAFDARADAALDHLRGHPATDRFFYGVSAVFDHSLGWMLLGGLRGLRSERDFRAAVRVGVGVFAESAVVNIGIKSLFRRSRPPWEVDRPLPLRRPRTSSFPSGHASAAFCVAALLGDDDPLRPLYYALAGVVALSRTYVRIHHASDVLGGIAIGVVLGELGRRLAPLPPRAQGIS
ncbi:MAG TPA: phosphatase PAP2 family protein [Acidimicrobiales bacterium]|nr:phosphatase PAP2 family protein [Acidimicrobiales bacterium]